MANGPSIYRVATERFLSPVARLWRSRPAPVRNPYQFHLTENLSPTITGRSSRAQSSRSQSRRPAEDSRPGRLILHGKIFGLLTFVGPQTERLYYTKPITAA